MIPDKAPYLEIPYLEIRGTLGTFLYLEFRKNYDFLNCTHTNATFEDFLENKINNGGTKLVTSKDFMLNFIYQIPSNHEKLLIRIIIIFRETKLITPKH